MTSQAIADVRRALATVEQPGRQVARVQRSTGRPDHPDPIRGLRLQKAAIGVVAVVAAVMLWIYLDWPDPSSLMVYVLLPVALNAMVPTFPLKGALKSLFWGPAIGALLYFVIMPPLSDMWQLAPLVVLCLLPTAYLTNSPNPSTMMFGLLTSLWAFLLIDISQGQAYSFARSRTRLLGIVGGTGVGLADAGVLQPAAARAPSQDLRAHLSAALRRGHRASACRPAGTGAGDPIAAGRAEALELVGLCEMWARHLDPARHPAEERATLGAMIAALRAVAFRLEALERARQRHPDEGLIAAAGERLPQGGERCAGCARAGPLRPGRRPLRRLAAAADGFRAALEPLHRAAHAEDKIQRSLHEALTLTGYYWRLIEAIEQCRQRTDDIDWRRWDLAYF